MLALLLPRLIGWVLALLDRIPAIAWLVLALAGWGWYGHHQAVVAQQERAKAALTAANAATLASQAARNTERALSNKVREISDDLQRTTLERNTAAANAANRLRLLANAHRTTGTGAAASTACSSYEGPTVAIIRDETRENLISLAADADQVTDQLRACQSYIRTVLGQPTK